MYKFTVGFILGASIAFIIALLMFKSELQIRVVHQLDFPVKKSTNR